MERMLESPDQEFRANGCIYTQSCDRGSGQWEQADRQCEQRNGSSRKEKKEMLETKHTVTEMKNAFEGIVSRLDSTQESIEHISLETSIIDKQRAQWPTKTKNVSKVCETTTQGRHVCSGNGERKQQKK